MDVTLGNFNRFEIIVLTPYNLSNSLTLFPLVIDTLWVIHDLYTVLVMHTV